MCLIFNVGTSASKIGYIELKIQLCNAFRHNNILIAAFLTPLFDVTSLLEPSSHIYDEKLVKILTVVFSFKVTKPLFTLKHRAGYNMRNSTEFFARIQTNICFYV